MLHGEEYQWDGRNTRRYKDAVVCRFEGCHEAAKSAGMCQNHYQFVRYDGERIHLLPEEYRTEPCQYQDCGKPRYAKGLCRSHFESRRRTGHPGGFFEERDVNPLRVRAAMTARSVTLRQLGDGMGLSHERVRQLIGGGRWRRGYFDVLCEMLDLPPAWLTREGPPEFDLSK